MRTLVILLVITLIVREATRQAHASPVEVGGSSRWGSYEETWEERMSAPEVELAAEDAPDPSIWNDTPDQHQHAKRNPKVVKWHIHRFPMRNIKTSSVQADLVPSHLARVAPLQKRTWRR